MSEEANLLNVINDSLCIGCGACAHTSAGVQLELNTRKGMYEPNGVGNAEAASVCPSVSVDFDALQNMLYGDATITPLGVIESVMLAQSTNYERNLRASSGGLIKELMLEFLAREEVSGVISLAHVDGLQFEPRLITKPEDVDQLPGSIYHSVSFEKALGLIAESEGRVVLIAIPCQLEGIYNFIYKVRPELLDRIYATIGLICGWQYTHHAIRAIGAYKGFSSSEIQEISFRGGGPVGKLRVKTPAGEFTANRRVDFGYQVAFDRSFNIPRCHLCINHTNVLADIVVGDAWLPGTVGTKSGVSIIICRTEDGVDTMRRLEQRGRIRLADARVEDVVESQTHRVAFGDFSYAYAEYLRKIGRFCPDLVGPNRSTAKHWSEKSVAAFHRANERKIVLQREGRYHFLYWRKLVLELWPLLYRYIRWAVIRVLRIKSLLRIRKEVSKEQLRDFI